MGSFGLCGCVCVCVCTSSTQHNTWLHIDWFLPFFFYSSEWIARLKGGQTKNSINVLSSNLAPEQRGAQAGSKWGDEARAKKVWTAKLQKAEKKGQSKRVYDRRSHRKFSLKAFWDYLNVLVTLSFKNKVHMVTLNISRCPGRAEDGAHSSFHPYLVIVQPRPFASCLRDS